MNQATTVTRLALRELWISFRLFVVLGSFVLAGAVVALLPTTPTETLTRLSAGFAIATAALAAVAATSMAEERATGRAGWLVTRSVARGSWLLGWTVALLTCGLAGLVGGVILGWLAASPMGAPVDAVELGAVTAALGAALVVAAALGLLLGTLLGRGAAAIVGAAVVALFAVIGLLAGELVTATPVGAYLLLPRIPAAGSVVPEALRAAGAGLVIAAILLALARSAVERADL